MRIFATIFASLLLMQSAWAQSTPSLQVQKITQGVYALVGENAQRSPENFANNATFGVVVTNDGVVLIDAGGSWIGATAIEDTIATITDKKVKIVINSGGQDHRWVGNQYWKTKGVKIIASKDAVADQKDRASLQMTGLETFLDAAIDGTDSENLVYADTVFDTQYEFELGGQKFEIHHAGHAHTPGDSFIWLKDKSVLFAGDIVYVERILGIGPQSHSGEWIKTFKAMAAFKPKHLVPGHGRATTLEQATKDTLDYLVHLRKVMGVHIENGGDMIGSVKVDQSKFSKLLQFKALAGRNAQQVYSEMEFE